MIRLFVITLLFAHSAFAQSLGGGAVIGGGAALVAVAVGGSFDFIENFETAGTGYDNSGWSAANSPNPTYATAPAPLEGTQSLRLTANASISRSYSGSTVNLYLRLNITTWSDFNDIVEVLDGSFGTVFKIGLWTPNVLWISSGGASPVGATALSTGTTYHIWGDYTKGTGANGVAHLYVSTTATKPGSPECTITTSTAATDVSSIYFKCGTATFIQDRIILNSTTIGSNP